jgi:hypothetical protein
VPQPAIDDSEESRLSDRWIAAEIIHQNDDAPPMARLADGQLTDIRAYMTWRRIPGIGAAGFARTGG